jgi:delta24-sterol reductase
VIRATAEHHRDQLFTAAGSCGSIRVITLLEMELIDASRYVQLQYIPIKSVQEAVQQFEKHQHQADVDYLNGIMTR